MSLDEQIIWNVSFYGLSWNVSYQRLLRFWGVEKVVFVRKSSSDLTRLLQLVRIFPHWYCDSIHWYYSSIYSGPPLTKKADSVILYFEDLSFLCVEETTYSGTSYQRLLYCTRMKPVKRFNPLITTPTPNPTPRLILGFVPCGSTFWVRG